MVGLVPEETPLAEVSNTVRLAYVGVALYLSRFDSPYIKPYVFRNGGVGESTITCNLAAIAAARDLRTLVVDLDPQANSTRYLLGAAAEGLTSTVTEFFDQMINFKLRPKGA